MSDWFGRRWRQFRNPPPPVLRAVLANLAVAAVGGLTLLVLDILAPRTDLSAPIAVFVLVVLVAGSALTYLWVRLPTTRGGPPTRTPWAALLGFFAALPICYIVLVVVFHVLRPLIGG